MKKYALIIACLAMASGAVIGQTGSSPGASGNSANEPSGASTSESSGGVRGGESSGQSSQTISEPSGAQAKGVITIQGKVSSDQEKQEIEQHVRMASGVKTVVNKITVSGQSGGNISEPSGAEKSDKGEKEHHDTPSNP